MIIAGDALECLRLMPDECAHCCVTSPPYYGLRDYGVAGQVGMEPTPEAYVARMVEVFREVRRVLRNDGTFWLNIGDSYNASKTGNTEVHKNPRAVTNSFQKKLVAMCKPKDLIGIPWMLAFALRADGWYLRRDIIWHKPNPMPESVTDRPTSAHEYLFLLTKSPRYFYDADAIREELSDWSKQAIEKGDKWKRKFTAKDVSRQTGDTGTRAGSNYGSKINPSGRNKRSVWTVTTRPYKGAHFATFPPDLIEPCILAGTSELGVCQKCAEPWRRVVAKERHDGSSPTRNDGASKRGRGNDDRNDSEDGRSHTTIETIGWRSTCSCDAAAVPATVLDPFFGAGTTGLVADRLGRDCIGVELNPAYALMAHRRIEAARPIKEAA